MAGIFVDTWIDDGAIIVRIGADRRVKVDGRRRGAMILTAWMDDIKRKAARLHTPDLIMAMIADDYDVIGY